MVSTFSSAECGFMSVSSNTEEISPNYCDTFSPENMNRSLLAVPQFQVSKAVNRWSELAGQGYIATFQQSSLNKLPNLEERYSCSVVLEQVSTSNLSPATREPVIWLLFGGKKHHEQASRGVDVCLAQQEKCYGVSNFHQNDKKKENVWHFLFDE